MPKITVIMPSLNVVRYIKPCIESVLHQTLTDIEILAVDAGSTDGTLEIWREYEKVDSRVKLILSEKKSYGYQINLGISLARGEYIGIVETDDMIVLDMYESLYKVAKGLDVDYVKGYAEAFVDITEHDSWRLPIARVAVLEDIVGKKISPCERPELLAEDIFLWLGIYRREFLRDIRLNETSGAAFQDQGFLLQTISRAKYAVYLDKLVYLYRQDNGNSSIYNKKGFRYLTVEYTLNQKYLEKREREWHAAFYLRMFHQCLGRFRNMAVSGEFWTEASEDIEDLKERLRQAVKDGLLSKDFFTLERWQEMQLFLRDPQLLYESYTEEFQKKQSAVNELTGQIEDRQVIIFGCGKWGRFLHALLVCKKVNGVVGYCDTVYGGKNVFVQGKRVMKLEEAVSECPDAVYVIANKYHMDEIKEQLHLLGIKEENILQYSIEVDVQLLFKK